jgi:O-acetylhomoserine/O-acetylserine sulfhydrylase-like pyridoxal-dependent enzyme
MKFETLSIHTEERTDKAFGAVSVTIYRTLIFVFEDFPIPL